MAHITIAAMPIVAQTFNVMDYGAVGNGATDDYTAIQNAINAAGTSGGTIFFPSGNTYYLNNSGSGSLKLPAENNAWMTFSGYGATIKLSSNTGRFLGFDNPSAPYGRTFQYFEVDGFTVDGALRSAGTTGAAVLGCVDAGGYEMVWEGSVRHIRVSDVTATNLPYSSDHETCLGITLGSKHNAQQEAVKTYVDDIVIDGYTQAGGDTCILISGQLSGAGWGGVPAGSPADVNIELTDIEVANVHFESGKNPATWGYYGCTGIMVNQCAKGGTVHVHDCYLKGTEDDLVEINNCSNALVENVEAWEAYDQGFQYRNQGMSLTGSQLLTERNCSYHRGRWASGSGFGYATAEIDPGTLVYDNCTVYNTSDTLESTLSNVFGWDSYRSAVFTAASTLDDKKLGTRFLLSADASVQGVNVRLRNTGTGHAACNVRALIYADSSGSPGALLYAGDPYAVSDNSASGWKWLEFPSDPALSPGYYWIMVQGDATAAGAQVSYCEETLQYGGSGGSSGTAADTYVGGAANPCGAITTQARTYAVNASYNLA